MLRKRLARAARLLGRCLRWGVLAVGAVCLVLVGWVAANGYLLYREAVAQSPLTDRVAAAKASVEYLTLAEMPTLYPQTVVAVEDRRFYSHGGVDLISIGRALLINLRTHSLAEGGSTITQQLAKNLCFTQEKRLVRKAAEVFCAWELERLYTKDELLELYINTIYYGSGYTGLAAAARGYFGCAADQLSQVQCTLLAGLPNAPSAYSPDADPQLTLRRQTQVLAAMQSAGLITAKHAEHLAAQAAGALAAWLPQAV